MADGFGRIDSMVVRPEFRRHGVASALVARAVADFLATGNTLTYLYTEGGGAGEAVYQKLGFDDLGSNLMRRDLAAFPIDKNGPDEYNDAGRMYTGAVLPYPETRIPPPV